MPDILDRAEEEMAFLQSLRWPVPRSAPADSPSPEECLVCGCEIDIRRRQAIPGVARCTPCQARQEAIEQQHRREFSPPYSA